MTEAEVRYLLKRYPHISHAIRQTHVSALISISGRKERIAITEDILKFSDSVVKTLNGVKDDYSRGILKRSVLKGETDVNIFTKSSISRGSYYTIKKTFVERLFRLCILQGLVSEDEL